MLLIALLATLLLGLYDYLHDRVGWKLKSTWLKYVIAFASAFILSQLEKWKFFQYLQVAAFVLLAGLFAGLLAKWLASLWSWVKSKFNIK